jgi:uncharacterized protein (TIGR03435 family)
MRLFFMRLATYSVGALILSWAALGYAQESPTFEVATVKPSEPMQASNGGRMFMGIAGGPGTPDPGKISSSNMPLKSLITNAYGVQPFQVIGPAWLDTERYDVIAKVPANATKEQTKVMWQNLLAERFGLVLHHESKEFQVDELVVAKGGAKMKETEVDPNAPVAGPPLGGPIKMDKNGFPDVPGPTMLTMMSMGPNGVTGRLMAKAQPISQLANMLTNQMKHPVVDKTGLTGKYDFTLEYTPDLNGSALPPPPPPPGAGAGPAPIATASPSDSASEPGTNLATAIQKLGLRLVSGKDKIDVLVIDKANKTPTEN